MPNVLSYANKIQASFFPSASGFPAVDNYVYYIIPVHGKPENPFLRLQMPIALLLVHSVNSNIALPDPVAHGRYKAGTVRNPPKYSQGTLTFIQKRGILILQGT